MQCTALIVSHGGEFVSAGTLHQRSVLIWRCRRFKATRTFALCELTSWQNEIHVEYMRRRYWHVLLHCLVAFTVNSINARPEERSGHRLLMSAVWPKTFDLGAHDLIQPAREKRDKTAVPAVYVEGGCWFWPSSIITFPRPGIRDVPVPRMTPLVDVPSEAGWNLLGVKYTLYDFCTPDSHSELRRLDLGRVQQRAVKGDTVKVQGPTNKPLEEYEYLTELKAVEMPSPLFDVGPDIPLEDRVYEETLPDDAPVFVNQLIEQLPSDLMQKVGETHDLWKHTRLTQDECQRLHPRVMRDHDIGNVFTHAQVELGTKRQWDELFEKLFKPKNKLRAGRRAARDNIAQLHCVKMWDQYRLNTTSENEADLVRGALKDEFDKFVWMIWCSGSRIIQYESKLRRKGRIVTDGNPARSASSVLLMQNPNLPYRPLILTHGHRVPFRTISYGATEGEDGDGSQEGNGGAEGMRQEEEESESEESALLQTLVRDRRAQQIQMYEDEESSGGEGRSTTTRPRRPVRGGPCSVSRVGGIVNGTPIMSPIRRQS